LGTGVAAGAGAGAAAAPAVVLLAQAEESPASATVITIAAAQTAAEDSLFEAMGCLSALDSGRPEPPGSRQSQSSTAFAP